MKLDQNEYRNKLNNKIYSATKHYQKQYGFKIGTGTHDTWNNEADAFKHAFGSAYMAIKHTIPISKLVGDYHEKQTQNNPKGEENMDKWNNRVGRLIAKEIRKEYKNKLNNMKEEEINDIIAKKVVQRMKLGKLITSPDDKRKFTGFASDIPRDKIFTSEEIGNLSNDEFEDCEDLINNQLKSFGIPNNFQAEQEVKAGNLIWVDAYIRDDGIEVNGYYRRK